MDLKLRELWLEQTPFFEGFPAAELRELAKERVYFKKFRDKELIIEEGDFDQALFIILKGSVTITKDNKVNEINIAKLNAGCVFGELSLLRKARRNSNVKANGPTVTLTLRPDTIAKMNPALQAKVKNKVLKLVLHRYEHMCEKYTELIKANQTTR